MKSLIQLAEEKRLPKHQYLDPITLNWIKNNKPEEYKPCKSPFLYKDILQVLQMYCPQNEWFLEEKTVDSIHGLRHILRCLVHVHILCNRLDFSHKEKEEILIATALHDCRRINDNADEEHGLRARIWFLNNVTELQKRWSNLEDLNINTIADTIEAHELPYDAIVQNNKSLRTINILKTADALDRYRQPKLKWRINETYLQLVPTKQEKFFAYELVVNSETKYLNSSEGSYLSVLKTVEKYVSD